MDRKAAETAKISGVTEPSGSINELSARADSLRERGHHGFLSGYRQDGRASRPGQGSVDESNSGSYFRWVNPEAPGSPSAGEVVDDLASRGVYHFTTQSMAGRLGGSPVATRAALRRLLRKGNIASPYRGFYVNVPPEYRRMGCVPAEQFLPQLMEHLGLDYYAALLTAGQYHGAAHQQPQVFQVMVAKHRQQIDCGQVRVVFIARRNVADIPTLRRNTPRGYLIVATPEATAFDLVGYPQHSGGLNNVATVLQDLAEELDPARLAAIAPLSPVPWAQRLGYLLELVEAGHKVEPLAKYVASVVNETTTLVPSAPADGTPLHARWRLFLNTTVEPDL